MFKIIPIEPSNSEELMILVDSGEPQALWSQLTIIIYSSELFLFQLPVVLDVYAQPPFKITMWFPSEIGCSRVVDPLYFA